MGVEGGRGTYILGASQVHNLVKRLPAIILSDGVALLVPDMVIGRYQDANRIGGAWERRCRLEAQAMGGMAWGGNV